MHQFCSEQRNEHKAFIKWSRGVYLLARRRRTTSFLKGLRCKEIFNLVQRRENMAAISYTKGERNLSGMVALSLALVIFEPCINPPGSSVGFA
jgi:hypothetical protein